MKKTFTLITLLIFSLIGFCCDLAAQVHTEDSLALVSLYKSTNGSEWDNSTNWLEKKVELWYGVSVQNKRVTRVNLSRNNLHGDLPDSICLLTSLKILNVADNCLIGKLPTQINKLNSLHFIDVSYNSFSNNFSIDFQKLRLSLGETSFVYLPQRKEISAEKCQLSISENNLKKLRFGPNPANDYLKISGVKGIVRLKIFSLLGNEELSYTSHGEESFRLELDRLKTGIYFLKMEINGHVRVDKLSVR
ncbi:MAG: T9SS type A sorting domain-containing protein [Bacteroidales bacterium]